MMCLSAAVCYERRGNLFLIKKIVSNYEICNNANRSSQVFICSQAAYMVVDLSSAYSAELENKTYVFLKDNGRLI